MTKILCEYTPCFKPLLSRYDVTYAAVYGAVWRYCQGNKHMCTATIARIAERAGVSGAVTTSRLNVLEDDGWIESQLVCTHVGWRRVMHIIRNASILVEEEEVKTDDLVWQHPNAMETPSPEQGDTPLRVVTPPSESTESPLSKPKKERTEERREERTKKDIFGAPCAPSNEVVDHYMHAWKRKKPLNTIQLETLAKLEEEYGAQSVIWAIDWAANRNINNLNSIAGALKTRSKKEKKELKAVADNPFLNAIDPLEDYNA